MAVRTLLAGILNDVGNDGGFALTIGGTCAGMFGLYLVRSNLEHVTFVVLESAGELVVAACLYQRPLADRYAMRQNVLLNISLAQGSI